MFSSSSSYIFQISSTIYLATVLFVVLIIPFPGERFSFLSIEGNFIIFAYMLALGRFFLILGAMDTASSFEGMGANREALYSMLVEPAFFILFGTLALITNNLAMGDIFNNLYLQSNLYYVIVAIIIYLLIQISMIDNSRMPVDDPKTHLELTMVHEVIVLDHSGIDLAMIQIATYLKFAVFGALIACCLIAADLSIWIKILYYLLIQIGFAITIGVLESFRARKKLIKNPQFIMTLSSIALIGYIIWLLLKNKV